MHIRIYMAKGFGSPKEFSPPSRIHSLHMHVYLQNWRIHVTKWQNKHFELNKSTSRRAALLPLSSPFSITSRSAPGRTFQNSLTNSNPFRRLFCRISFARYKKANRCSRGEQWNCLSHVSTTCFALYMWKIHQCDKAWSRQGYILMISNKP